MNVVPSVAFSLDAEAVGWIVFDAPGNRPNVFDAPTQEAFAAALDQASASAACAIVVMSAKERIFIAGADLRWLQSLPNVTAATAFSHDGQGLFQRLSDVCVPTVCAIHGACAGGGFELALACDWRMASDAAVTQIGLPETSIGTIPGWGGCTRLPRLIGAERAVEHILRAQLISADAARREGLVDEVVVAAELKAQAKAAALRLATSGKPNRPRRADVTSELFASTRQKLASKTRGQQPAPLAALDAVQRGLSVSLLESLEIEARCFGEVTAGPVCKNLIHVFFLREAAKKRTLDGWFPESPVAVSASERAAAAAEHRQGFRGPAPIRRVGIVGAGVMGSGIAHWLATRGFEVVLRDVQIEFVERARGVIRALLDDAVKRGKTTADEAAVVFGRIRTTTTWDAFSGCDLVIEAIVENIAAKRQLFSELVTVVAPDALLASNTSALPIDDIAEHISSAERTLGLHFFNPVSRMPLVELVIGKATSRDTAARALGLIRTLGKSPVICRSSPGFVVTRVLFFYLNAAVQLWERGVSTMAIDTAMRDFGWPMGPLRLIDEVGVDVTAFIFGEMAHYFPKRFAATTACAKLMAGGLMGRKNGGSRGFYRYVGAAETVNDAETRASGVAGAEPLDGGTSPPESSASEIVARLMCVMTDEAQRCLDERVVLSADDIDFALLSGAGFPAFRGGLLRWANGDRLK